MTMPRFAVDPVDQIIERAAELRRPDEQVVLTRYTAAETRSIVDASNGPLMHFDYPDKAVQPPTKGGRVAPHCRIVPVEGELAYSGEETSRQEVAAPTPYESALPESGATFTGVQVISRRLGAFVNVTKDALTDRGLVQEAIDTLLHQDLGRVLDAQVLSGDGTGENLAGLLPATSANALALGSSTHMDALLEAAATVRDADFIGPLYVAIKPSDLHKLLTDKASNGLYTFSAPALSVAGIKGFIKSSLVPAGTVLLGDFNAGATLYIREGVTVYATNSHGSNFIAGITTMAVEGRFALRCARAAAFTQITGW